MQTIVKMIFGSHLYGTDSPSSDKDYKGIFMPSREEVLLGKIPKSLSKSTKTSGDAKNSADDVDEEMYSLHYFIHLACEGETVALDMLHATDEMIIEASDTWCDMVRLRDLFYTKSCKAFVGYARRQAAKYGVKGSRLADAKLLYDFLSTYDEDDKLKEIWQILPETENISRDNNVSPRIYNVCGRMIQDTVKIGYARGCISAFINSYGERARLAAENKGVDWKAVSHAFRAAYQMRSIFKNYTIIFPLPEREFLRDVKYGKYEYSRVAPMLDELIDEVEELSRNSSLPEKVDRRFWNEFVMEETWTSLAANSDLSMWC